MAENINISRKFLYLTVCTGNLVAFSAGIMLGWTSPVMVKLTNQTRIDENPFGTIISNEQVSWISSLFVLGSAICPIISGLLTNKIGQKKVLLFCSAIPLLVSFLVLAFGKSVILYYIARFISGFAYGTTISTLPNFLSEISEVSIRGMVASSMSTFIMSGTFYSYVVGPYLSIMWFNITCAIWPTLFLVLFYNIVPESPYYLIASDNFSGAVNSLKKFRSASEDIIMPELMMIKYSIEKDMEKNNSFSMEFKSKGLRKALIISLCLITFEVFSGISIVLFNAQFIFGATEAVMPPEISAIIVSTVQVCASCIAPLAVDRIGRKELLLISAIGMLIAEVPLGLYFYLHDTGKDVSKISWLPMVCMIGYIIFYTFGFGSVPWTVISEVFPANIKACASTSIICYNAILGFTLTKCFPSLVIGIGLAGTFWLFSSFCAMAVPFLLFYMIETNGKTFQEIQNILSD